MRSTVLAGDRISASQPVALIRSRVSLPTFASAPVQRCTTSGGRLAGPSNPYHAAERVSEVTAIGRILPPLTAPTAGPSEENSIGSWPPIRSVIAGPPPL